MPATFCGKVDKIRDYYDLGYTVKSRTWTLFYFPTQKYFTILF